MSLPAPVCAPAYRVATHATHAVASVLFEDWSSLSPVALVALAPARLQQRVVAKPSPAVQPTALKVLADACPLPGSAGLPAWPSP